MTGARAERLPDAGAGLAPPCLAAPCGSGAVGDPPPHWVTAPLTSLTLGPAGRPALTRSAGGALKPSASVEGAQAGPSARDPAACARDRAGPPAARPALLGHQLRWPQRFADAPFAAPRLLPRAACRSAATRGQAEAEGPNASDGGSDASQRAGGTCEVAGNKARAWLPGRGGTKSSLFTRLSLPARLTLRQVIASMSC